MTNLIVLYPIFLDTFVDQYYKDLLFFFTKDNYKIYKIHSKNDLTKIPFTSSDIIVAFFFDLYNLNDIKCKEKIYWVCDMHNQSSIVLSNVKNADLIITQAPQHEINRHIYLKNKKILSLGWSIKISTDLPFNKYPKQKLLLSGAISDFYPFRQYVHHLSQTSDKIEIMSHPGYKSKTTNIVGDKYIQTLNNYLCCFCCAGKNKYIFKKNIEIIASGSLLVGDDSAKYELEQLGFIDFFNCMLVNSKNFNEKLKYILDEKNRDEINRIRLAGFELSKHFSLEQSYNKILDNLLGEDRKNAK
jgi:hypothetical protein